MKDITAERLREVLDYDPATGVFTWKARTSPFSRVNVGDVAGGLKTKGYIRIKLDGRELLAHRLAWLYVNGEWPADQIDHISGIRTDNRIVNLRLATNAENQHNQRKPQADNTTGFLGVSPEYGKFKARIVVDGKNKHLGMFHTPEEAHAAYVDAKRKLHKFGTL